MTMPATAPPDMLWDGWDLCMLSWDAAVPELPAAESSVLLLVSAAAPPLSHTAQPGSRPIPIACDSPKLG